ncbi:hypothetical protein DL764_008609 [Monosporascus ibericus]|uniref:Kelch repeat-containing protein n=1 Tax=Monosporascus ibericus TaxID=155417 RepID=A0A4Q4T026_9PEZI|nr:hypothetical protein DL764_008609 [Monosporascus ibericus]
MSSNIRKGRRSIFREEGLEISDPGVEPPRRTSTGAGEKESRETTGLKSESTRPSEQRSPEAQDESKGITRWLSKKLGPGKRPGLIKSATSGPPSAAILSRVSTIVLLIAVVLSSSSYNNGRQTAKISDADAAVTSTPGNVLAGRQNSPTDVCTRWAGQYNDFLTLDLTESWDINSPALTGLPRPDGPPAVSLGYLWNDYNHLFLYGGQFSDDPPRTPDPVSTWMYDIDSSTWIEFEELRTSAGNYSAPEGERVQRSSEGAGVSVPELGLSWYFGGHLDLYTTPGWSIHVARVYLRSLLEFTHPGYSNDGVDDLHNSGAPEGGAYRNITQGGIQNERGFTERADGVLVYVPGWGPNGILLGLGGGSVGDQETTDAFASMTTIDVYDIRTSEWYHQETQAEAPRVRVNPCAVVFSAPDASSFNIYMYGGQNLLPYGEQMQYTDVWILTVPSFTWIKVDIDDGASYEPPARAGHHCAPRDGQLVVVGGYVGEDIPCDSPGIYVFDASELQWRDRFEAADHPADDHADNSVLAGSYGYRVPEPVQSVVGGDAEGGATVTTPAAGPATDGPFATGQAPVFTVTAPASTATVTSGPDDVPIDGSGAGGTDAGKIVAGVIAGLAGLAALYLGFCAWLYRRQVGAYKRHMAVANRYNSEAGDGEKGLVAGTGAGSVREKLLRKHAPGYPVTGSHRRGSSEGGSSGDGVTGEQFGWVGQQQQQQQQPPPAPGWVTRARASEDAAATASIGEGTTSSSGPGSAGAAVPGGPNSRQRRASLQPRPSEDRSPWSAYEGYAGGGGGGIGRSKSDASASSGGSVEGLLDGREPNFFRVVLGPRRALRVVNGMENEV